MSGSIDFEFRFQPAAGGPRKRAQGEPLRILVLGDFSGRAGTDLSHGDQSHGDLAARRAVPIDLDNFEAVMARLAPRLDLALDGADGGRVPWRGESLDDFHPDRLYRAAEIFGPAGRLRERLLDPASFAEAAAELKREAGPLASEPQRDAPAAPAAEAPAQDEDRDSMLDRLLGKPTGAAPRAAAPDTPSQAARDLSGFIERLVAPHVVPDVDLEQGQLVSVVEDALARQMRAVLHHPDFQAMEARWRALHWLTTNLETGEDLQVHVLDAGKDEIAADLHRAGGEPAASGLYKAVVEGGQDWEGGPKWSLLVGAFTFGAAGDRDLELLAALGALGSHGGGPFLAAADPGILGGRSWHQTPDPADWPAPDPDAAKSWQDLRRSPVARWIGLAAPRVLLRRPYGPKSDPIESFGFDELSARRDHEGYLWGNPAFACALLIGQGFQDDGWSTGPGDRLDLEDLPAHSFTEDGEAKLQACAEAYLGERAATAILERGPMALLSYRNRNAVRLARFQSIADPPAPLAGPWSG
jgi:type VI secretion system protein ImpC